MEWEYWYSHFRTKEVQFFVNFKRMTLLHSRLRDTNPGCYQDLGEFEIELKHFIMQKELKEWHEIQGRIQSLREEIKVLESKLPLIEKP
jgi:hypothetical protein